MGYTTTFKGEFIFNAPVDEKLKEYINKFSRVRHMKRDVDTIKANDPLWRSNSLFGELGANGEYYIGNDEKSILSYNTPSPWVPGLWCQWIIKTNANGEDILCWDGGEKFYNWEEWLKYLIDNFFEDWEYQLNGRVYYQGEDSDDYGMIEVIDNIVTTHHGVSEDDTDLSHLSDEELIYEMKRRNLSM